MPQTYDTKLTPEEEARFAAWAEAAGRMNDTEDYDLRGAWKADAKAAANGHLPDTWKKPNHPTFSQESMYAKGLDAGKWEEGQDGQWTFTPGLANFKHRSISDLEAYFKEREPDARLNVPPKVQVFQDTNDTLGWP